MKIFERQFVRFGSDGDYFYLPDSSFCKFVRANFALPDNPPPVTIWLTWHDSPGADRLPGQVVLWQVAWSSSGGEVGAIKHGDADVYMSFTGRKQLQPHIGKRVYLEVYYEE